MSDKYVFVDESPMKDDLNSEYCYREICTIKIILDYDNYDELIRLIFQCKSGRLNQIREILNRNLSIVS